MVFDKEHAKRQFASWLNDRLDAAGVVQGRGRAPAVAKKFKVSTPAARKWLDGIGMPDMSQVAVIAEQLGLGEDVESPRIVRIAEHLLPYDSTNASGASEQPPITVSRHGNRGGYIRLPLLTMEVGMGNGTEINEHPDVVDFLDVAEWWAVQNLPKPHSRIKIITGRGDSNAPLINHGDIIFVDTAANSFDGEGLYVFNWNGRALVKRLVFNMRTQGLRIVSENPAYPAEDISLDEIDQLHVAGRVVAWYTLRRS